MDIGQRIRDARIAKHWSQARLSEEVGQSQTTISSWERGRTEPSRSDVERVARALGLPREALENVATLTANTIPVIGLVQAGSDAILFAEGQGPFDQAPAPAGATRATVAVRINGTCLGRWMDRGLAFYDDVRNPVTEDLLGRLCVIGLPDGRVLIKELRASKTRGAYHLFSAFEDPLLDQPVEWAARVINIVQP